MKIREMTTIIIEYLPVEVPDVTASFTGGSQFTLSFNTEKETLVLRLPMNAFAELKRIVSTEDWT